MKSWRDIAVNVVVFKGLKELLASGEAVAYVGAGASASLYPLWSGLIRRLAEAVETAGARERESWCRDASSDPLTIASMVRDRLDAGRYANLIHDTFKPRAGADGNRFTAVHAALMRLPFRGYVTTNYDISLSEARAALRPGSHPPPFTWEDDDVSRWIQGRLFDDGAVPVLHAHGIYNDRKSLVLASEDFRGAYRDGPYRRLFQRLWGEERLVIVGFGFSDPWVGFIADEAITGAGVREVSSPSHVAIVGLPVEELDEPGFHRERLEKKYHTQVLFYPVSGGDDGREDHSALLELLAELEDQLERPAPRRTEAPGKPAAPPPIGGDAVLTAWLEQVTKEHRRLTDHFERPVELQDLEKAWVELELAIPDATEMVREKTSREFPLGRRTLEEFLALDPAEDAWVKRHRWLVEGDPGSGKTTLLRHLAARLAKEDAGRIPVFISLPRLLEPFRLPLDYLAEEYGPFCGPELSGAIDDAGRAGRLLVLLDGLDEVPPEHRDRVRKLLARLDRDWPLSCVVVAGRPLRASVPVPGFHKLVLQPLDDEQRGRFLENWFRHRDLSDPTAEAARAGQHFDVTRGLRELSHNPLHLTLLTVLWEKGVRAPQRRSELYDEIFRLLLEGQHKDPPVAIPASEDVREVLRHVAYWHTREDLPAEELTRLEQRLWDDELNDVCRRLVKLWGKKLRDFLAEVHERTYILGPHDGPRTPWRFWHRTFREALTAEELEKQHREKGEEAVLAQVEAITGDLGRWAEPFALVAGRLGDADRVVTRLVEKNRSLGLRALATAQGLKEETLRTILKLTKDWKERRQVFESIPEQLGEPEACLALVDRLRRSTRNGNDLFFLYRAAEEVAERSASYSGRVRVLLDRFFDHIRPPEDKDLFSYVETRDGNLALWREMPAGEGWIGSPKGVGHDDEHPRHKVTVVRPFWLAAVPVTNAQYMAFDPDRPWRSWKGVDKEDLAHHPVVDVTWYEAVSFCRWLSTLPGFAGVRLPTEEEWEYACRAGSKTAYWKGDDEKALKEVGWYDQNSGNRTHRVGEKLANPWGLYDVHGNVWEWTASTWKDDYSGQRAGITVDPAKEPADLAAPPGGGRVVRGGCCWSGAGGARSAFRSRGDPDWGLFGDGGFRVLAPSPPA